MVKTCAQIVIEDLGDVDIHGPTTELILCVVVRKILPAGQSSVDKKPSDLLTSNRNQ